MLDKNIPQISIKPKAENTKKVCKCKPLCVCVCLQTGERIRVAIKTCKDCSADVKEKFLSEAGECIAAAVIVSFSFALHMSASVCRGL